MVRESVLKNREKDQAHWLLVLGLVVLTLFAFNLAMLNLAHAGQVTLAWDAGTGSNLAGYKLYIGQASGSYQSAIDVGNTTTYTVDNLSDGEVYYFAASTYDVSGNESSLSGEIAYAVNNHSPVADAGPAQNASAGSAVTLSATNSYDPDGDPISYTWTQTGGTTVVLSDPNAAEASFTAPDVGAAGESLTFSLTVVDAYGSQTVDTCTVNVVSTNLPPVADAGSDQAVQEWAVVMLDGSASSDSDDGIKSYAWAQIGGPGVTLMDADLAQPTFVAPDVGPEGAALTFQVTVLDMSGLQSTDTCVVNVSWVNTPPVANAGPDQSSKRTKTVTLNGSASTDADDGIASYRWSQATGTPVTLSDPAVVNPTFKAPNVRSRTTLEFDLTVTDSSGLQSTDRCKVTVK